MPPCLADIFVRPERVTASPCEAPGCAERTREEKRYCTDHVFRQPYVKRLIEIIEASIAVDADAEWRIPDSVSVTDNITVGDLVMHLMLYGTRTEERLTRELRINPKTLASYATALENQGVGVRGRTARGSTTLRLSETFRNEIVSGQSDSALRLAAICYNDAKENDGMKIANGVKPKTQQKPKSDETERQLRRLEAAHTAHLGAVESALLLRTDEAVKFAKQRLDDIVKYTESLNAKSATPVKAEKPKTSAQTTSRPGASPVKAEKPETASTNSGRVLEHLLKNLGKPVMASVLIKHIHTKPKCSSMQANLASIVAGFKRRGYKVASLDISGAKHYRLENAKPR